MNRMSDEGTWVGPCGGVNTGVWFDCQPQWNDAMV